MLWNAIHALGYTVLRNQQAEQAWAIDVKSVDMESDAQFVSIYARTKPFTMTTMSRMYALYKATEYVTKGHITGDIVECGVWRGGSSMLVALALQVYGVRDRNLYLYDTFDGMSQPTEHDIDLFGQTARDQLDTSSKDANVWARASLDDVQANLSATAYPSEHIRFVEGRVETTIPLIAPERIAILRLDTDWYESTAHELHHLYPRLVPGGVLIIDDYGHWEGARKAVDEYFAQMDGVILLNRIDYTGRIGVKMERFSG